MAGPIVLPEILVTPPEQQPPPPPPGPGGGDVDPSAWAPQIIIRDTAGQPTPLANPPAAPPAEAPSLPSDDNFLTRSVRSIWDLATGESRIPDAEQYTPEWIASDMFTPWQKAGISVVAATASDPKALEDAVLSRLPEGAKIERDVQGNTLVSSGGKRAYLNKPGISMTDALPLAGMAATNIPVAGAIGGLAGLGGRGAINALVRGGAQGLGQGLTELGKSLTSIPFGNKQGVDWRQAAEGAVGGAVGEPAAATVQAAGRLAARTAGRFPAPGFLTVSGNALPDTALVGWNQITRSAQQVLQRLGYGPQNMPPDFTAGTMRRWADIAPTFGTRGMITADTPEALETARRTLLEARFDQRFTLGQRTGDAAQLGREDFIRRGGPEPAQGRMKQFSGGYTTPGDTRASQQGGALEAAAPRLMGPAGNTMTDAEYADRFRAALLNTQQRMEGDTTAAYGRLGATTGAAMRELPLSQQVNFGAAASQDIVDALNASRTAIINPGSEKAARHVADLIESPSDPDAVFNAIMRGRSPIYPPRVKGFNLGDYNETRRKLTDLWGATDDPTTRSVARNFIRALDDAVDNATTRGGQYMQGSAQQVDALRQARAVARREFAAFKPENPEVAGFLERVMRPGVSGVDVADALIGAGNVGSSGSTSQILAHIGNLYPAGSPAGEAVRQAFKYRMIFGNRGTELSLSPGNMANRFDQALNGPGRAIMRTLLTPGELEQARAFSDMLRIQTEIGARNPSGTAYVIANWLRRGGNAVGWINKTLGEGAKAERDVRIATGRSLPDKLPFDIDQPLGLLRSTVAPAAGGEAGSQGYVKPAAVGAFNSAYHPVDTANAIGRGMLQFYNWDQPNGPPAAPPRR